MRHHINRESIRSTIINYQIIKENTPNIGIHYMTILYLVAIVGLLMLLKIHHRNTFISFFTLEARGDKRRMLLLYNCLSCNWQRKSVSIVYICCEVKHIKLKQKRQFSHFLNNTCICLLAKFRLFWVLSKTKVYLIQNDINPGSKISYFFQLCINYLNHTISTPDSIYTL